MSYLACFEGSFLKGWKLKSPLNKGALGPSLGPSKDEGSGSFVSVVEVSGVWDVEESVAGWNLGNIVSLNLQCGRFYSTDYKHRLQENHSL